MKSKKKLTFSLVLSFIILNSMASIQFGVCSGLNVIWHFKADEWVRDVDISDDGTIISAVGYDQHIYLFNNISNTPLWSYQASDSPKIVALSSDGEYIITGSSQGYVRFFTKSNSTPQWSYKTGATTGSVAICPDGAYIVVGSNDNHIYLFNKSGFIWKYYAGKSFVSVALASDGSVITGASSSGDYGKVYTFNKSSNSPLWNYDEESIHSVAISADGNNIVSGCGLSYPGITPRGNISLFQISSSTPLWYYTTAYPVGSVVISSNGHFIAATHGDFSDYDGINNVLYFFERNTSSPIWTYDLKGYPSDLAMSDDGRYVIIGLRSNKACYFDTSRRALLWTFNTPGIVESVDISSEGGEVVIADKLGNVWLIKTVNLPNQIPSFHIFITVILVSITVFLVLG